MKYEPKLEKKFKKLWNEDLITDISDYYILEKNITYTDMWGEVITNADKLLVIDNGETGRQVNFCYVKIKSKILDVTYHMGLSEIKEVFDNKELIKNWLVLHG